MAKDFGFHKPFDKAFPNAEDGGIIDLNDAATLSYQMVPVGGRRMVSVDGPADRDCEVAFDTQGIAHFAERSFVRRDQSGTVSPPSTADSFRQFLPAGLRMTFDIKGMTKGRTELQLRSGGAPIAAMKVAVKAEIPVSVSMCRLEDIEFTNPFDEVAIREAMAQATTTYKNTANVSLIVDPTLYAVQSDISLGNPVVLGRQVTEYDLQRSTVLKHIIAKTPAAAKIANLVVVFGWDFEITHLPIVGVLLGRFCFVEFDRVAHNRIMTLEHEIGHGLGLGHTQVKSIMNGNGFNGVERFEADEIDILNKD